jgi:carbon-monoxide dehydrogenase medium subunit
LCFFQRDYTFAYTTALESHEILTEVIFPLQDSSSAGVYLKLERVAGDFAVASAAVQMGLDRKRSLQHDWCGCHWAGTIPQKAVSVESLLQGKKITPELIDEAGRLIWEELSLLKIRAVRQLIKSKRSALFFEGH